MKTLPILAMSFVFAGCAANPTPTPATTTTETAAQSGATNKRVYDKHDLDRSGRVGVGGQLRTLDPDISTSRNGNY